VKVDLRCILATALAALALISGCGGHSGGSASGGGANPTIVSVSFSSGTPTVVAAKIGAGSFTSQSLTSGKLSLSLPAGTTDFAVAYVCTGTLFPTFERIFEATTADGTSFTLPCVTPRAPDSTGALTGNVDATAIPQTNLLTVMASNGSQFLNQAVTPDADFSLTVPAGTDRVEVLAYDTTTQGFQATSTLLAARNLDNQTVPGSLNGGAQVVFTAADRTTAQTITYSNLPAGYSGSTLAELIMAGGAGGFSVSQSSTQYSVVPAAAMKAGDSYAFVANAMNSANPTQMMIVATSSTTAVPVSFTFPEPWSYSGPAPAALPVFNIAYTGFTQTTGVTQSAVISWGFALTSQIFISATASYQGGSTALAIPDLSALSGFLPPPPSGTPVIWVALIAQNNTSSSTPILTSVENSGTYTVP
jgi:hypothetical protein